MSRKNRWPVDIAKLRGICWCLALLGIFFCAVPIGSEVFELNWCRIPHIHNYAAVAIGIILVALLYQLWRCPECGKWPGQLNSKICASCGAWLVRDQINYLADRVDAKAVMEKFAAIRDWIERFNPIKRIILFLGFLGGLSCFYFYNGLPSTPLDWAAAVLISAAIALGLKAAAHNLMIYFLWKCPACRERLPLFTGITTCPYCGVQLADDAEEVVK